MLNWFITGLIVRGEHEARGREELTAVLLLDLVAGFLTKSFLALT